MSEHDQTRKRRSHGIHPTLLDVMCCLVFIFMLTSLLAVSSRQEALERTLPPVNLSEFEDLGESYDQPANSLVVSVVPGPAYMVDNTALSHDQLANRLTAERPDEVEIRGDESVSYGCVMSVMRLCRQAGVDRVALTYKIGENDGKH